MKLPSAYFHTIHCYVRRGRRAGGALFLCSCLFLGFVSVACQTNTDDGSAATPNTTPVDDSNDVVPAAQDVDTETEEALSDAVADEEQPTPTPEPLNPDEGWNAGPHAHTYVLDDSGNNANCARCHSPAEWFPGPDDIPESCLTCKFDVDEPEPLILEESWGQVDCKTCHKVKDDEVEPDYLWLDIAVIEEYVEVDSTTELCRKCHEDEDVLDHKPAVHLSEDHQDLSCTDCHDAHQTTVNCTNSDCHMDTLAAAGTIAGHDVDHQLVTCMACHDAEGLEVGPEDESGVWKTFTTISAGDAQSTVPHSSHKTQIEVACDRCHYANNAWDLSEDVSTDP